MRGRLLGVLLPSLLAALVFGCGGDDSPPDGSPSPGDPSGSGAASECANDLFVITPLTTVSGGFEVDYLGDRFSLASGDFNADGFDDALMGAPLADGANDERLNSGEAYIIFGGESLPQTVDASEYQDFVVYGAAPQDNLGLSVAAGDVNGDGIDDVLVGARFASPGGKTNAGETYVILGREGLSGQIDTAAGDPDVTIAGIETGDFSGILVAAGDVTGDGAADIIIGAIAGAGPNNDRSRAGEIYIIEGGANLPSRIDLAEDAPFATIYGATREDALPGRLAVADLNGNGRNEVIAGAPQATPDSNADLLAAGLIYAIEIPGDGGVIDLETAETVLEMRGAQVRDSLGYALAVGDVNGDGTDDLIAAARDADGAGGQRNNSGEVYVVVGGSDLPATIDLVSDEPDARISGRDENDSLGFSVATADFNGDGRDDILIGAALADSCGNARQDAGEIYLVPGRDADGEIDLATAGFEPVLYGAAAGDELGFSLAAGDFTGDGVPEILAGALLADGPEDRRFDAGEVYIVGAAGNN